MKPAYLTKCANELAELRAAIAAVCTADTYVYQAPPPRGPAEVNGVPVCHELRFTRNGHDHVIQYRHAVKCGELSGRRYMRVDGRLCNSIRGVLNYLNSLA